MLKVLAIDPGNKGAFTVIGYTKGRLFCFEYSIFEKNMYSSLFDILKKWKLKHKFNVGVIEKVSSMPTDGIVSAFTFGYNFGFWQGILASFRLSVIEVKSQEWQKVCGVTLTRKGLKRPTTLEEVKVYERKLAQHRKKHKELIVETVKKRYPELKNIFNKKKNWDIADSVLIGEYYFRKYGGGVCM